MFAGEGFHSLEWRRIRATFVPLALLVGGAQSALGTDITGVLPGALDQPQVNFIVRPTDTQDAWHCLWRRTVVKESRCSKGSLAEEWPMRALQLYAGW